MRLILRSLLVLMFVAAYATQARQAAVAMPDSYSADAAMQVLENGGNAVDAAVTAGFVLAVTLPEAGNIGGGGFMLTYMDKQPAFLDYRETAPGKAHRDMFLDKQGQVVPYQSLFSGLAVGTPGTVAGLWQAHQKYGTKPWHELLAPAIKLAEKGFIVHPELAQKKRRYLSWIQRSGKARGVNFQQYFAAMQSGKIFRQPELAKTLRRIAKAGAKEFYQGETADLLVAQMQRVGGLIAHDDLKNYRAVWRKPLTAQWRSFQVLAAPPPSSGGFGVIQLLKMKAYLDPLFAKVRHNSASYIHLTAEMEKRVYADRAMHLGDPDFYPVPIEKLLREDYIKARAAEVNPMQISDTERVKPGLIEGMHTTHYSIVDFNGNAVANTYTLNTSFGSGIVVEGAGFLLNNEMDDFSAKPGVPNVYGVVGDKANEIAPRKRMLSSMAPTILLDGDEVKMVVGTPGGSTIITSVYQTIVNAIDYGMSIKDAVSSTRFHHQLLPKDEIKYHPELPQNVVDELTDKGYTMKKVGYLGYVEAILRNGQELTAAADWRSRGKAIVKQRQ